MTLYTASPDDIINELEAIAELLRGLFANATIYYQRVPEQPNKDDISLRFQNASTQQENVMSYVDIREWQIIVFGEKTTDAPADPNVMRKMETIKKATVGALRQVIPINDGSLRYMRIVQNGFSYSAPVLTEDGRHACVGILQTEVRRARNIETYEKIMQAGIRRV